MIDTVQAVLLLVIVLLTVLLLILGTQVFFILKEIRSTVIKANRVLDNAEDLTEKVSEPLSLISGLFEGTKIVGLITKLLNRTSHKKEDDE